MTRKDKIQMAVLAALGCTKIDYRSPKRMDDAAERIARFVEMALDEDPKWVRNYEASLASDEGPAKTPAPDPWRQ
jgi:hypothetical protein